MDIDKYKALEDAAFSADIVITNTVEKLRIDYNAVNFIETGTYIGTTTKFQAYKFENVFTVENTKGYFDLYGNDVKENVHRFLGSSPVVLKENILLHPDVKDKQSIFFLDAHWDDYWPLRDELKEIANANLIVKPIIVIHDFQVPERPDLGFDSYRGHPLNMDYIVGYLPPIYPNGYNTTYNIFSAHRRTGTIFITPNL